MSSRRRVRRNARSSKKHNGGAAWQQQQWVLVDGALAVIKVESWLADPQLSPVEPLQIHRSQTRRGAGGVTKTPKPSSAVAHAA